MILTKRKPLIDKIYVFVGENLSKEIKSILHGIQNGGTVSKESSKILEKEFGEEFYEILCIGYAKKFINGGGNNAWESDRDAGSDVEGEAAEADGVMLGGYDSDSDSDSIDFEEEDSDTELFNEKIEATDSFFSKPSKNQEPVSAGSKVIYVYKFIYKFFRVSELLALLENTMGIRQSSMIVNYYRNDDETIVDNLIYKITFATNNTSDYYVNYANVYANVPAEHFVRDLPADPNFRKHYNSGKIVIHDLRDTILIDHDNLYNDLMVYSIDDVLKDALVKGAIGVSESDLKAIYEGFIVKYTPQCTYGDFKLFMKPFVPKGINGVIDKVSDTVSRVFSINVESFDKLKPTPVTVATASVKTRLILGEKSSIFDLRLLFKLFTMTKEIPFAVFYDQIEKTKQLKYHIDTEQKLPYLVYNWKKNEAKKNKIKNYISFKVLKYTAEDPRYTADDLQSNEYTPVHLYSHGGTETRISWNYSDNVSFEIVNSQIMKIYTTLTASINRIDPIAFIGYKLIPFPSTIDFFSIKFKFDIPNGKIGSFKALEQHLIGEYPEFFARTGDGKITSEKMNIYYIRNSPNNLYNTKDTLVNKLLGDGPSDEDIRVVLIEIDNNYHPRIVIQGPIQNHRYFAMVYNLIVRVVMNYIVNVQGPNVKIEERKVTQKSIVNSRLRSLQLRDDVLFNFKTGPGENPYSRICQQHKQPNAYTRDEFAQLIENTTDPKLKEQYIGVLERGESIPDVLVYENKTHKSTFLYYTCSDKIYKFPGFQTGSDKHPIQSCLPCCKKMPSVTSVYKNLSNNMKQYLTCIGKESLIPVTPLINTNGAAIPAVANYVKIYGKDIGYDRIAHLPVQLAKLFNIKQNYTYITPNISSIFVYGTVQGKWSIINAVLTALGVKMTMSSEEYFLAMIDNMAEPENEGLYSMLANGFTKQAFPSIYDYKNYILTSTLIDEYTFIDFIRVAVTVTFTALAGFAFNIIILADEGELKGGEVGSHIVLDFIDKDPLSLFRESKSIVLLRQNNLAYYPIATHNQGVYNSVFGNDHLIIKKLKEVLALSATHTRSQTVPYNEAVSGQKEEHVVSDRIFTIDTIEELSPESTILGQIVNAKNMVYSLTIMHNKHEFSIPVQTMNLTRRYPILHEKIKNPSIPHFLAFYNGFENKFPLKFITMNENDEIVGFYNSIGMFFRVLTTKDYTLIDKSLGRRLRVSYRTNRLLNESVIDEAIYQHKESKFSQSPDLVDYRYTREIYELFKLEISNYIANQKNEKLRKKITSLLSNPDTRIKDLLDLSIEHPEVSNLDREVFKKLFDRPIESRVLDNNHNYSFDRIIKNNLIELSKEPIENKEPIIKTLAEIANDVVSFSDDPPKDFIDNTIRTICNNYDNVKYKCENSSQCAFSAKTNKCKLIMNSNDFNYFLEILSNDFIYNEYIRESIIYNTISPIKIAKESKNANHVLEMGAVPAPITPQPQLALRA